MAEELNTDTPEQQETPAVQSVMSAQPKTLSVADVKSKIDTQTPLSLDYTGLSVLTTAGLQKVDAQLQTTKTELQNTKEDVRIAKDELQTKANDVEFKLEKDKIAALETDLEREKLKTTNLQERILVMEHAYHALLERVSDLENQT